MKLGIRFVILSISFSFFTGNLFAQKSEVGILAGGSYYYGDIVTNWQPKEVNGSGGIFYRYHFSTDLSIRGNLMYARVSGADSNYNGDDAKWQVARNLAFYSNIIEVSGVVEYNLIKDQNKGRRIRNRFIPYVFGGIGLFYFEPMAIHPITGKAIALRPLQTNGTSYLPVSLAFPLGFGIRYYVTNNWQIGLEFGPRITTTSSLDDVPGSAKYPDPATLPSDDARIMSVRNINSVDNETQMGNKTGQKRGKIEYISDVYFIGGVTISYRLWPGGVRKSRGSAIRCPRFY